VNSEKRTVDVIWTTGAKVLRSSWLDGPFFEELSLDPKHVRMGRLMSGSAPFLANHDGRDVGAVLGVITAARLEKGRGVATVRFAPAGVDVEADKVFSKIEAGIIRNVSVGYRTYKVEKLEDVEQKIPTLRAVDWEPYEISAVSMGADDGAGFRSDVQTNPVVIVTAQPRSRMETENEVNTEELAKRERERVSGIRAAVRTARLGEDIATTLINKNVTLDKARAVILDLLATRDSEIRTESHITVDEPSGITMGRTEGEKRSEAIESALLMRSVPALVMTAKAAKVPGFERIDTGPNEFRSMTLVELARETLKRQGLSVRMASKTDLVGRAFTTRAASGPYAGTADFPILLENVMNKILLGAYETTPDTWSRFCKVESVPDFRDSPRYRTGSIGVLDPLNENGEFRNKAIPDGSKLSINVQTKGNIIGVSRQMIINDDLSAFSDLGTRLGRAARLSIEVDVYALLALNGGLGPTLSDSQPFFHSSRGNVNGTASALGVPGLDADRVLMAQQRDAQNNEFLDIRPQTLLVASSQGGAARVLNDAQYDVTETQKFQVPNRVRGLFRDVVDTPRLSGTRRYLFANPDVAAAIVVAFLDGQQSPVLETDEGWRADGTEMKVRFDYRAQMFDPKGALTNAGA
jgi:hypothetical protein